MDKEKFSRSVEVMLELEYRKGQDDLIAMLLHATDEMTKSGDWPEVMGDAVKALFVGIQNAVALARKIDDADETRVQ